MDRHIIAVRGPQYIPPAYIYSNAAISTTWVALAPSRLGDAPGEAAFCRLGFRDPGDTLLRIRIEMCNPTKEFYTKPNIFQLSCFNGFYKRDLWPWLQRGSLFIISKTKTTSARKKCPPCTF